MTDDQHREGNRRELVGPEDQVVMSAGDDRVDTRDIQDAEQDADRDEVDLLAGVEARRWWLRCARKEARGYRSEPLAVLHVKAAQFACGAAERPTVPRLTYEC